MRSSSARTVDLSIVGHLEVLTSTVVSGWVQCSVSNSKAVLVTARLGGVTLFTVRASKPREDVGHAARGKSCGFVAPIPPELLAEAREKVIRAGAQNVTLDLFVHPVVGSSVHRARLWRQLGFDEYNHILEPQPERSSVPSVDGNLFFGLVKRITPQTIGGWCVSSYPQERRSRIAVSLYVDGLWVDTQFAVTPILVAPMSERMPRTVRGLASVALRFRFQTPKWMCDGREHEVCVALAERPDWLIDEPHTVCLEPELPKADAFAMPPLQVEGTVAGGPADGPKRGEYEAWIRANRRPRPVATRSLGPLPGITALIETTGMTDQPAIDETVASLRARSARAREIIMFGQAAGEEDGLPMSEALARVDTEYVAVCRAGDRIAARAFETLGQAALAAPEAALIFADDDLRDQSGRRRRPRFKTQYCPDRALTDTLFDGLTLVRTRDAVEALAGDPVPVDGRTLLLKVARRAGPAAVRHEPAIVCHRRLKAVAEPAVLAQYVVFVRALLAAEAAAAGADAPRVKAGTTPHVSWPRPADAPTMSVVMPTRDGAHLFEPLIDELMQDARGSAIPLDVVLVDNGSTSAAAHAAFVRLREKGVRILPHREPFNFSALCNVGAKAARGDILLFIHDDIVGLSPGLLDEMLRQAIRPDVGAVGARLAFPDGTNQHCGVALGVGGVAAHLLKGHGQLGRADHGRFRHVQTVSAVTAALMAVRREAFEAVGGFDTALSVSHNDVDLCLRLAKEQELRTIYTPYARAYHLESQVRGVYLTAEERARLAWEASYMRARWGDLLDHDPYVSPNHSRANAHLSPTLPETQPPVTVAAE